MTPKTMQIENEDPEELVTIEQETERGRFSSCSWDDEATTVRGLRRMETRTCLMETFRRDTTVWMMQWNGISLSKM